LTKVSQNNQLGLSTSARNANFLHPTTIKSISVRAEINSNYYIERHVSTSLRSSSGS